MTEPSSSRRPSRFFQVVTTRPVAVLCVVMAFVVFGTVSLSKLQTTLMPNLEYPQLTIRTNYPAAAPSEVEEKVSQRIEERLGNVSGLGSRSSISRAESSDVVLQFGWGTDMLQATADVRDRLDRIDFDDQEVQRPQILRYDPAQDPTMRLVLYANDQRTGLLELRAFADDILKPELSKIEGVAAVRVSGGEERQIRVSLIEAALNRHGLTAQAVVGRISAARVDSSAGVINLAGLDVILRVVSTYESLAVLEDLELNSPGQGRVTLKEVANIEAVPKERDTITRFAGDETSGKAREGVLLEVLKEGDANILQVAQRVWIALYGEALWKETRKQRGELTAEQRAQVQSSQAAGAGAGSGRPRSGGMSRGGGIRMGSGGGFSLGPKALVDQLPPGFGLRVVSDQSYFIEDAVNDVTASAILGAILAVLVLFFFLRSLKATALIAVSIPLSIMTTFIPMQMTGVTLNLMSLGGLALGVGMLVDNSVVVLESIARCKEEGDDLLGASIRGISEVGGAILASTMTTVAVFFPIVFVDGVAGQIFRDLSLTVVFSLLASLIVAQFVVPPFFGLGFGSIGKLQAFSVTRKVFGYPFRAAQAGKGPRWLRVAGRVLYVLAVFAVLAAPMAVLAGMNSGADAAGAGGGMGGGGGMGRAAMGGAGPAGGVESPPFAWASMIVTLVGGIVLWMLLVPAIDTFVLVVRYIWRSFAFVARWLFKPLGWAFEAVWTLIAGAYPLALRAALAQPLLVVAVTMVAAVMAGFAATRLETELLPRFKQDEFYADFAAPEGTQIADTDREAARLAQRLLADKELSEDVSRITLETGGEQQAGETRERGTHVTRLVVGLRSTVDAGDVTPTLQSALRDLGDDTSLFQASAKFSAPSLVRIESGLQIEVRGSNTVQLGRVAQRLVKAIAGMTRVDGRPMFLDVRSSLSEGRPQVQLVYDRLALQRFGLTADAVTREVRNKIGGAVGTQYSSGGEDLEVFVELLSRDKRSLDQVRDMQVATGVRLRDVLVLGGADLRPLEGPSEIRRVGNQRAVVVFAEPNGIALGGAADEVQALIASGRIDTEEAEIGFAGQAQEMSQSVTNLVLALLLALFLVYVVMAVQFESLLDPLVIMVSVPFAGVGVVFTLAAFGMPISVMVLLGMIVLAGIVVNNAIVLVSYANQLRDRGQSPREAALNASRIRLRPIAITTLTTLLGLLPMTGWLDPFMPAAQGLASGMDSSITAVVEGMGRSMTAPKNWKLIGGITFSLKSAVTMLVGGGEGAEVRKPLAVTVIAGLSVSTLLTLFVIPTLWSWVNTLIKRRRLPATQEAAGPEAPATKAPESDPPVMETPVPPAPPAPAV
ncbi:MAG: efflux RND transporter permease subunit [Planctomycetes bacterium]|nr:efflux RND transporter permease subunit [Planctomycetota bacterium]